MQELPDRAVDAFIGPIAAMKMAYQAMVQDTPGFHGSNLWQDDSCLRGCTFKAFVTASATSIVVIEELHSTFTRFGLPELIMTDNGPCFTSEEFGL